MSQSESADNILVPKVDIPQRRDRLNQGYAYLGGHRGITTTAWGHLIYLNTRDVSLLPHLIHQGLWEPRTTSAFMSVVKPGHTVLEVGANIGYYTLLAGKCVGPTGQVHAFEANDQMYSLLVHSLGCNGLRRIVRLDPRAVYSTTGEMIRFSQFKNYTGGSHVGEQNVEALWKNFRDEVTFVDVETVTVDDYCEQHGITPDVIKIDAEGAEPDIFQGMTRLLSRAENLTVIFEFGCIMLRGRGVNPRDFLESIVSQDYQLGYCGDAGILKITVDELCADESRLIDLVIRRTRS